MDNPYQPGVELHVHHGTGTTSLPVINASTPVGTDQTNILSVSLLPFPPYSWVLSPSTLTLWSAWSSPSAYITAPPGAPSVFRDLSSLFPL
ncbi:hypothetical protein PAXRUDRAFT_831665 [Paxillus rubicundulus Ve08.2h10]|uniref:Uncharacterized protein n=1 Tax=Paxillus rubicundulus Ve08.2h10 TaxID=930991 RepID=A0A0D0D1Y2_9AGAM|nr:hypothetical protein PAXRUDRAFT_831665 [Paxillus rubicundulus Ve08.2h10]